MTPAVTEARRRELHAAGKLDAEIAAEEGVSKFTIRNWRYRHALPGNDNHYLTEAQEGERRLLHAFGMNDYVMARSLGVHQSTINRWRARGKHAPLRRRYRASGEIASCGLFSLDEPDRLGRSKYASLADASWSPWLEEMGATVW